ncbi:BtpA/SgcQ family protein [Geoglobus sp.]
MIIGVLHLKPLPGSPHHSDFDEVIEHAVRNAVRLEEGGVSAILVENFGDAPFLMEVGKETVACMTAVVKEIVSEVSLPIGVNVLRNDAIAAAAVAKAVKADFIRVNQAIFPSIMPEGLSSPVAGELARFMRAIDLRAMVFADVGVKHAVHVASLEDYAENIERSFADAVIVTGTSTGSPPNTGDVRLFRELFSMPVLVGSGVNDRNILEFSKYADGFIVGSYFKKQGEVDVERVRKLCSLLA